MATVNANPVVVCGQGRIGSALTARLQRAEIACVSARLSPANGLYAENATLPKAIQTLVVCIAPGGRSGSPPKWRWQDIFYGFSEQLKQKSLQVENLIMVSSTRVYESVERGLVTAETPVQVESENAQGLVAAEKLLLEAPINTLLLRATGLYGALYPVYTPIMLKGESRPRFGVDAARVVDRLVEAVAASEFGQFTPGIELLTDGKVYYQGRQWHWPEQRQEIERLAQEFRILLNSRQ